MINEKLTKEEFGYYSTDLKQHSRKKIVVACEKCGKMRRVRKDNYAPLCTSCCQKGKVVSEEARRKASEREKGKKLTKDHKQKIGKANSGVNNFNYGKHLSEEIRRKIGDATRGEKNHNYGRDFSDEYRCKLRKSQLGKHLTEETRQKIGEAERGEKHWN